jgi:cytidylate kinase
LIYSEGETFEELVKNINLEEFKEEAESKKTFKMHVDARGRQARYN